MCIHFPAVAQTALHREELDERADLGIELDTGILFAKVSVRAFVCSEQHDYIVLLQNVVLNNLVFLFGVIMIEDDFRLFVLEKFQRDEGEAFACDERIDLTKRMIQPFCLAKSLLQVGREGE